MHLCNGQNLINAQISYLTNRFVSRALFLLHSSILSHNSKKLSSKWNGRVDVRLSHGAMRNCYCGTVYAKYRQQPIHLHHKQNLIGADIYRSKHTHHFSSAISFALFCPELKPKHLPSKLRRQVFAIAIGCNVIVLLLQSKCIRVLNRTSYTSPLFSKSNPKR
jgi:hypothetical protein